MQVVFDGVGADELLGSLRCGLFLTGLQIFFFLPLARVLISLHGIDLVLRYTEKQE